MQGPLDCHQQRRDRDRRLPVAELGLLSDARELVPAGTGTRPAKSAERGRRSPKRAHTRGRTRRPPSRRGQPSGHEEGCGGWRRTSGRPSAARRRARRTISSTSRTRRGQGRGQRQWRAPGRGARRGPCGSPQRPKSSASITVRHSAIQSRRKPSVRSCGTAWIVFRYLETGLCIQASTPYKAMHA